MALLSDSHSPQLVWQGLLLLRWSGPHYSILQMQTVPDSPLFRSTIFAVSKDLHVLGGYFVWAVMTGLGLLGVWSTFGLIDGSTIEGGDM